MWPYHLDLLAPPVLRYISYPTAAEFGLFSSADHAEALGRARGNVSLYVHIPSCEKICFYRGCNTGKAGKRQRLESYLDALCREIDLVSELLPFDASVRRIAFGGGSPNAISPTEFLALVNRLIARFSIDDPAFSIELDPRTFSAQWAMRIAPNPHAGSALLSEPAWKKDLCHATVVSARVNRSFRRRQSRCRNMALAAPP
jgi:oxygen-independent coproporphyrinogen III oxidase